MCVMVCVALGGTAILGGDDSGDGLGEGEGEGEGCGAGTVDDFLVRFCGGEAGGDAMSEDLHRQGNPLRRKRRRREVEG